MAKETHQQRKMLKHRKDKIMANNEMLGNVPELHPSPLQVNTHARYTLS